MTPNAVVEYLELSIGLQGSPRVLAEVVEECLHSQFGMSLIAASENCQRLSSKVKKIFLAKQSAAEDKGVSTTLIIVGSTEESICGACHVSALDDEHTIQAKNNRLATGDLLKHLRKLSFNDFEKFGKQVLFEIGAGTADVSPHSNDQGIDFFGKFNFGEFKSLPKPFYNLAHDVNLLFTGQAKHYPNSSLGPNIVRELIGAVSLARTKTHSQDGLDIFKNLDMRPFSPVIALLFTTGKLSSGARHLAAASGMIAKDGAQLAAFLSDQGVGIITDETGSHFDETVFQAWLNK